MPTDGVPIQDLAFNARRLTPKTGNMRHDSHGSVASNGSSSVISGASARRRFFPSNLFNSNNNKKDIPTPDNLVTMTQSPRYPSATAVASVSSATGAGTVVKSMKVWDVRMPPIKKHMVSGHLVPTVRGAARLFIQKHRRVSIEVHGPPVYSMDSNHSTISSSTPMKSGKMQEFLKGGSPKQDDIPLQDKDVVFVRILKLSNDHDDSHSPLGNDGGGDDDEEDLSTLGPFGPDDMDEHYVEHYSYRLEDVVIHRTHGRICEMKFGSGHEIVIRDIKFEAEKDALLFEQCLADVQRRVRERAKILAERYRESKKKQKEDQKSSTDNLSRDIDLGVTTPSAAKRPERDTLATLEEGSADVKILVDIVSAINLPTSDLFSADAYIVVRLGSREVHRTKVVYNTSNPIWTAETNSLFLLEMTSEDFFASTGGLSFVIKDYDRVGRNDIIGKVVVPHEELLKGKGDRIVYDIVPGKAPTCKSKHMHHKLVLRFREATSDDADFLRLLNENSGKIGIYSEETLLPPRPPDSKMLKRMTKGSGELSLHRVKPYPDPTAPDKTKWMTTRDLHREAEKESRGWVEAGSGELGKLYVEIIGCDGLPNMDINLNPRDKTDAFVCLVYEDVVVNTDVIGDTLKPRWMPWCCRAFAFNISHPQSKLFVGIFDYDSPIAPAQLITRAVSDIHDPIGRVTINLGRYLADTVYNLKMPIYLRDEDAVKGLSRGTISLRLRIEWDRPRQMIIAAAMPPPQMYVSCAQRIHWSAAHYTVEGLTDESSFSIGVLSKYIAELKSYEELTPYVADAALNLILWRGSYSFSMCGTPVSVPLHSMTAFAWGMLIAWNFNFFPAFLVFAIGWGVLAMNQHERQNPSPWHRPRDYWSICYNFLLERKLSASIEANQHKAAFDEFRESVDRRKAAFEAERKLMKTHSMELRQELSGDIKTAGSNEVDIQTKKENLVNGFVENLNLLKPILYPAQLELAKVLKITRICVSVIRWDEPYLAWWITTSCFIASLLMIWIPWGFIIRWLFRVTVFVFLGPWMAIYDRCFLRRQNLSREQQIEQIKERVKANYQKVKATASINRTRMERAIKLKSMKKYLYGKYLVTVPHFCVDGTPTNPFHDSSAHPFENGESMALSIVDKKYGQNLTGDMIPIREFQLDVKKKEEGNPRIFSRLKSLHRKANTGLPSENEPLLGGNSGKTNVEYRSMQRDFLDSDRTAEIGGIR